MKVDKEWGERDEVGERVAWKVREVELCGVAADCVVVEVGKCGGMEIV